MELESDVSKFDNNKKQVPSLIMEIKSLFLSFVSATKIKPQNRDLLRSERLSNMQRVISKIQDMDLYSYSYEELIEMNIDPTLWWVCFDNKTDKLRRLRNKTKIIDLL